MAICEGCGHKYKMNWVRWPICRQCHRRLEDAGWDPGVLDAIRAEAREEVAVVKEEDRIRRAIHIDMHAGEV